MVFQWFFDGFLHACNVFSKKAVQKLSEPGRIALPSRGECFWGRKKEIDRNVKATKESGEFVINDSWNVRGKRYENQARTFWRVRLRSNLSWSWTKSFVRSSTSIWKSIHRDFGGPSGIDDEKKNVFERKNGCTFLKSRYVPNQVARVNIFWW